MKKIIRLLSQLAGTSLSLLVTSISKLRLGDDFNKSFLAAFMQTGEVISYKEYNIKIVAPNRINRYRIRTFRIKEPATIEWIELMEPSTVFWDIGANIGLYSILAAKAKGCNVFAFEPSVFNLESLVRNIHNNGLHTQVVIIPVALSNANGVNTFHLSSTEWGGALSTFQENYDQYGEVMTPICEYRIPGLTLDDVVESLRIPTPDYIKLDVDGIEHLILAGGRKILRDAKSVLVEINDNLTEQSSHSSKLLKESGLTLLRKDPINGGPGQYNQWWERLS